MTALLTDYGRDHVTSSATFSPCRTYRYLLSRHWGFGAFSFGSDEPGPTLAWVMLNPSTADALEDDPTIRRCMGFAKAWGYAGITVVNLFAVRSTDPAVLHRHPDPVGPDNDDVLRLLVEEGGLTDFVAAWGAHPTVERRAAQVVGMLRVAGARFDCLGLTKDGHPRHPLYVAGSTKPIPFGGAA